MKEAGHITPRRRSEYSTFEQIHRRTNTINEQSLVAGIDREVLFSLHFSKSY